MTVFCCMPCVYGKAMERALKQEACMAGLCMPCCAVTNAPLLAVASGMVPGVCGAPNCGGGLPVPQCCGIPDVALLTAGGCLCGAAITGVLFVVAPEVGYVGIPFLCGCTPYLGYQQISAVEDMKGIRYGCCGNEKPAEEQPGA